MARSFKTVEEMRAEGVARLQRLKIYKPYINDFKNNKVVTEFEPPFGAGYWTWQNEKLDAKIKEIEANSDHVVYAVTHELTDFGELYDLLFVSKYGEEWDSELEKVPGDSITYYAFVYTWNVTDDFCSEYGSIAIQPTLAGGIRRVG